jgi:hypothetical protein
MMDGRQNRTTNKKMEKVVMFCPIVRADALPEFNASSLILMTRGPGKRKVRRMTWKTQTRRRGLTKHRLEEMIEEAT